MGCHSDSIVMKFIVVFMLTQRKQDSSPQDMEQQVRKAVARQHTKDIQEYMKQIHSKDRELSELKRKLAKVGFLSLNIPC